MLRDLFSLFPAYAGVILEHTYYGIWDSAFPRIRGGDPQTEEKPSTLLDFSPHTRG